MKDMYYLFRVLESYDEDDDCEGEEFFVAAPDLATARLEAESIFNADLEFIDEMTEAESEWYPYDVY